MGVWVRIPLGLLLMTPWWNWLDTADSNYVCSCGGKKSAKGEQCKNCRGKSHRKVERPHVDHLKKEVAINGFSATARKYGVSDNAIRKWM